MPSAWPVAISGIKKVFFKKIYVSKWCKISDLSVFILLLIFISHFTSHTLSLRLRCDCIHLEFMFLCLPLLKNTVILSSWDFSSILKDCSRTRLNICSHSENFHERGWAGSLCVMSTAELWKIPSGIFRDNS